MIIVATNASTELGGEAILPWHYFRLLRQRGVDAHLVTHERNRDNLLTQAPGESSRIHFTKDRRASRFVERAGMRLPRNVKSMTVWLVMAAITALDLRRAARSLAATAPGPVVVHEPVPVSPRQPSFMTSMGAPVVIGPLNGGMTYPPGFQAQVSRSERVVRRLVRSAADVANLAVDGKRRAAVIMVANQRTSDALPRAVRAGNVVRMVENGVDLTTFAKRSEPPTGAPTFAFVGRLVDWKRVDLLLRAMVATPRHYRLEVVGTGTLDNQLMRLAAELGVASRVRFHGQLSQDECAAVLRQVDALVLPSIYECGGAVVLEAMAVGLPVIAADWGGPASYVVAGETGLLIDPSSPAALEAGLASSMRSLGEDRALAWRMGAEGRARVEAHFDWERKIDQIGDIYRRAVRPAAASDRGRPAHG
ncbi:glycosyltransferase family 4 protein [Nocardioides sp. Leaf307]|uniref:glycosyltransferase family 4 protein n=1 Tax=Nocardioides sp. Leaf307 TaxID=1736331 RepID=UPI000702D592|nr:glycosyltransferase family 4 protein [Nocardioides sp. Leaf307]KQQ42950.1 hypothetical protein ASF50_02745 [Nocardioides sp. Leaf307]